MFAQPIRPATSRRHTGDRRGNQAPSSTSRGFQVATSRAKRTTCDSCRDRKVKCDRGNPVCGRCKRLGIECAYAPLEITSSQLSSLLQDMQSRLVNAELSLQGQQCTPQRSQSERSNDVAAAMSNWDAWSNMPPKTSDQIPINLDPNSYFPTKGNVNSWDMSSLNKNADDFTQMELSNESFASFIPDFGLVNNEALNSQPWMSNDSSCDDMPLLQTHTPPAESHVSLEQLTRLHHIYFDQAAPHLPFINSERFYRCISEDDPSSHHVYSLKHAVAMAGAFFNFSAEEIERRCYALARSEVEKAERGEDGAGFLNLETAQALILIARREFTKGFPTRGLMTTGRAVRLLKLLGCDAIDEENPTLRRTRNLSLPQLPYDNQPLLKEMVDTWWAVYVLDCYSAARHESDTSVDTTKIRTRLPQPFPVRHPYPRLTLNDFHQGHCHGLLTPMSGFVLASKLTVDALKHRQNSLNHVLESYNFCAHHDSLEKKIESAIEGLPASIATDMTQQTRGEMAQVNASRVMLLGLRILLHSVAIIKATDIPFMEVLADRSRELCLKMAQEISNLLETDGIADEGQVGSYRDMSMFLAIPFTLAAQTLTQAFKDRVSNKTCSISDDNLSNCLGTVLRAMTAMSDHDPEFNTILHECELTLGSSQTSNVSSWAPSTNGSSGTQRHTPGRSAMVWKF